MSYNFIMYQKTRASSSRDLIKLNKSGNIIFPKTFREANSLGGANFVRLYHDKPNNAIAFVFSNTSIDSSYKISKTSMAISATKFIKDIEFTKTGYYEYTKVSRDDETYYVIKLT